MHIKKICTLLFFTFACIVTQAQENTLKTIPETKALSEKVTKLFSENKISAAIKELKQFWPLPANEVDGFEEKSIKYLNMVTERFGKSIGTVKINEETIKDFAIRETYFVRFERTAIRLKFIYYKTNNGWIVNAFKWDDNFTEEFK